MYSVISTPGDNSSVFRPIKFVADVVPDKYTVLGSPTDILVNITGSNADGNCVVLMPSAFSYSVGDSIYLLSGTYKGRHKIYYVSGATLFLLTPFVGTDSNIGMHHIENNPIIVTVQNVITMSGYDELCRFYAQINEQTNQTTWDISGYLQSIFTDPWVSDGMPNPTTQYLYGVATGDFAFGDKLVHFSGIDNSVFADKLEDATHFTKLMASQGIVFQGWTNVMPFLKSDGVREFIWTPQPKPVIQSWWVDAGYPEAVVGPFNVCDYCDNGINIVFLNKYGAFQNYVCFGVFTYGRQFSDPTKFLTSYPEKLRLANSGQVFKTIEVDLVSISSIHRDVVVEMIESPVTMIWDEDSGLPYEIVIDKASYKIYNSTQETFSVKFNLIVSERVIIQSR